MLPDATAAPQSLPTGPAEGPCPLTKGSAGLPADLAALFNLAGQQQSAPFSSFIDFLSWISQPGRESNIEQLVSVLQSLRSHHQQSPPDHGKIDKPANLQPDSNITRATPLATSNELATTLPTSSSSSHNCSNSIRPAPLQSNATALSEKSTLKSLSITNLRITPQVNNEGPAAPGHSSLADASNSFSSNGSASNHSVPANGVQKSIADQALCSSPLPLSAAATEKPALEASMVCSPPTALAESVASPSMVSLSSRCPSLLKPGPSAGINEQSTNLSYADDASPHNRVACSDSRPLADVEPDTVSPPLPRHGAFRDRVSLPPCKSALSPKTIQAAHESTANSKLGRDECRGYGDNESNESSEEKDIKHHRDSVGPQSTHYHGCSGGRISAGGQLQGSYGFLSANDKAAIKDNADSTCNDENGINRYYNDHNLNKQPVIDTPMMQVGQVTPPESSEGDLSLTSDRATRLPNIPPPSTPSFSTEASSPEPSPTAAVGTKEPTGNVPTLSKDGLISTSPSVTSMPSPAKSYLPPPQSHSMGVAANDSGGSREGESGPTSSSAAVTSSSASQSVNKESSNIQCKEEQHSGLHDSYSHSDGQYCGDMGVGGRPLLNRAHQGFEGEVPSQSKSQQVHSSDDSWQSRESRECTGGHLGSASFLSPQQSIDRVIYKDEASHPGRYNRSMAEDDHMILERVRAALLESLLSQAAAATGGITSGSNGSEVRVADTRQHQQPSLRHFDSPQGTNHGEGEYDRTTHSQGLPTSSPVWPNPELPRQTNSANSDTNAVAAALAASLGLLMPSTSSSASPGKGLGRLTSRQSAQAAASGAAAAAATEFFTGLSHLPPRSFDAASPSSSSRLERGGTRIANGGNRSPSSSAASATAFPDLNDSFLNMLFNQTSASAKGVSATDAINAAAAAAAASLSKAQRSNFAQQLSPTTGQPACGTDYQLSTASATAPVLEANNSSVLSGNGRTLISCEPNQAVPEEFRYRFDAVFQSHLSASHGHLSDGMVPDGAGRSRRGTTEYSCSCPGVSWNTRMQSWLVYYEDSAGRKSRTFNPKRLSSNQLDVLPPSLRSKYTTDPVEVAMHCACVFAAKVRWEGRIRKTLGIKAARISRAMHQSNPLVRTRASNAGRHCGSSSSSSMSSRHLVDSSMALSATPISSATGSATANHQSHFPQQQQQEHQQQQQQHQQYYHERLRDLLSSNSTPNQSSLASTNITSDNQHSRDRCVTAEVNNGKAFMDRSLGFAHTDRHSQDHHQHDEQQQQLQTLMMSTLSEPSHFENVAHGFPNPSSHLHAAHPGPSPVKSEELLLDGASVVGNNDLTASGQYLQDHQKYGRMTTTSKKALESELQPRSHDKQFNTFEELQRSTLSGSAGPRWQQHRGEGPEIVIPSPPFPEVGIKTDTLTGTPVDIIASTRKSVIGDGEEEDDDEDEDDFSTSGGSAAGLVRNIILPGSLSSSAAYTHKKSSIKGSQMDRYTYYFGSGQIPKQTSIPLTPPHSGVSDRQTSPQSPHSNTPPLPSSLQRTQSGAAVEYSAATSGKHQHRPLKSATADSLDGFTQAVANMMATGDPTAVGGQQHVMSPGPQQSAHWSEQSLASTAASTPPYYATGAKCNSGENSDLQEAAGPVSLDWAALLKIGTVGDFSAVSDNLQHQSLRQDGSKCDEGLMLLSSLTSHASTQSPDKQMLYSNLHHPVNEDKTTPPRFNSTFVDANEATHNSASPLQSSLSNTTPSSFDKGRALDTGPKESSDRRGQSDSVAQKSNPDHCTAVKSDDPESSKLQREAVDTFRTPPSPWSAVTPPVTTRSGSSHGQSAGGNKCGASGKDSSNSISQKISKSSSKGPHHHRSSRKGRQSSRKGTKPAAAGSPSASPPPNPHAENSLAGKGSDTASPGEKRLYGQTAGPNGNFPHLDNLLEQQVNWEGSGHESRSSQYAASLSPKQLPLSQLTALGGHDRQLGDSKNYESPAAGVVGSIVPGFVDRPNPTPGCHDSRANEASSECNWSSENPPALLQCETSNISFRRLLEDIAGSSGGSKYPALDSTAVEHLPTTWSGHTFDGALETAVTEATVTQSCVSSEAEAAIHRDSTTRKSNRSRREIYVTSHGEAQGQPGSHQSEVNSSGRLPARCPKRRAVGPTGCPVEVGLPTDNSDSYSQAESRSIKLPTSARAADVNGCGAAQTSPPPNIQEDDDDDDEDDDYFSSTPPVSQLLQSAESFFGSALGTGVTNGVGRTSPESSPSLVNSSQSIAGSPSASSLANSPQRDSCMADPTDYSSPCSTEPPPHQKDNSKSYLLASTTPVTRSSTGSPVSTQCSSTPLAYLLSSPAPQSPKSKSTPSKANIQTTPSQAPYPTHREGPPHVTATAAALAFSQDDKLMV